VLVGSASLNFTVWHGQTVQKQRSLAQQGAVRLDLGAAPGAWSQYERRRLGRGGQVDLVLSDMAPSLSGIDVVDQPRSMELALDMAAKVLKGGGDALMKVFQGAGFQELVQDARGRFAKVKLVKPAASRSRSPEMYLLAKDFRLV
jgi:23S rRNA U2552 (ribose-2'-O)-methylase RlmE/FtsJ